MLTLTAYDPDNTDNTYEWQDAENVLANAFASARLQPLEVYFPPVGAPAANDWDLSSTIERLKAVRAAWDVQEGSIPQEGPEHQFQGMSVDLAKIQPVSTIRYTTKDEGQYIQIIDGPAQEQKHPDLSRLEGLITFCEQAQEHQAELAATQE